MCQMAVSNHNSKYSRAIPEQLAEKTGQDVAIDGGSSNFVSVFVFRNECFMWACDLSPVQYWGDYAQRGTSRTVAALQKRRWSGETQMLPRNPTAHDPPDVLRELTLKQ